MLFFGTDANGEVCEGILSMEGSCCVGDAAAIASDGSCCSSGVLDACGTCEGPAAAVDIVGTCCNGTLAASGLCCTSSIDTCGVCDGDHSTCLVVTTMNLPESSIATLLPTLDVENLADERTSDYAALRRWILEDLASTLRVPASSITITRIELVDAATALRRTQALHEAPRQLQVGIVQHNIEVEFIFRQNASAHVITIDKATELLAASKSTTSSILSGNAAYVSTLGVCGNGVCEHGEMCMEGTECSDCQRVDCPYIFSPCPTVEVGGLACSGRGKCIGATGTCSCFWRQGYTGVNCDVCGNGAVRLGNDACGFDMMAVRVVDSIVTAASGGIQASDIECINDWSCIGLSICGTALVIAVVYYVVFRQRGSKNSVAPSQPEKERKDCVNISKEKMPAQSVHWQCFVQPGGLIQEEAMRKFERTLQVHEHTTISPPPFEQQDASRFTSIEEAALSRWRYTKFDFQLDLQHQIDEQLRALRRSSGAQLNTVRLAPISNGPMPVWSRMD
jgi:hypothetical protein